MIDHIGENAALYALGLLEIDEQHAIDAHLAHCDACRRLLAQAEADVAAMAAAQPQLEPPATMRAPLRVVPPRSAWDGMRARVLAFAAVVVIALLPSGYLLHENLTMRDAMMENSAAIARVMSTPHRTVAFAGTDAHVMYGMDGSWYVIVVRDAEAPLHVLWPHDGTSTMLGTAMPHGQIALLYLPQSHRMQQLTLEQNGRVVGQAQLAF